MTLSKLQPLEDALRPLHAPAVPARLGAQEVATGALIPKIQRVRTFSADEWEEFIEEWAHSLHDTYVKVKRYGGSGDMGCDVVGFLDEKELRGQWVSYQCKHYEQPLSPSRVWVEIGKICWYSYQDEYTWPSRYYFVAPRGVGTKLGKLLKDANTLKQRLLESWVEKCESCITSTQIVSLTAGLRNFIEDLDFSIFDSLSVNDVIERHSRTCWHRVRFGGGLPPRPEIVPAPSEVQRSEIRYVEQLLEAYGDDLKQRVDRPEMLESWPRLKAHFGRSREQFFSAEALNRHSPDDSQHLPR